MSDENALSKREAALERLTPDEEIAYRAYCKSGKPDLSIGASLKLYELFIQGMTCEEISKLNPLIGLGPIVKARVEHFWDEKRDAYLADLYLGANDRLRQVGAESLNFLGLVLAATHKEQGEKLKKYLMTGDPKDLGDMRVISMRGYKDVVETLIKLTGQDRPRAPAPPPPAAPNGSRTIEVESAATGQRLTPEQADKMRAVLVGKK